MATVHYTRNLLRFFPELGPESVPGGTVAELLSAIDARHPGLAAYLVDERGALRKHVNIFVGGEAVLDRAALSDRLGANAEVHIIQALSGG